MRTLLVCCLVALAVSASIAPFKAQKTYVYRFDTQIASSLIGASPADVQQSAATRLRADVLMTFNSERHINMQLKHIRIGELNADLPKSERVQPLEHFERKELSADLKEILEYPLSVTYNDGVVERINFHEDDSTWSKNIKRAVLNMLQLNLKRNDVQGLKMQSSMPEQNENKDSPMFTIPEITLEGECEVVYTVQKSQRYGSDNEQEQFNVTKSINFNKCQKTADVSYGYQANPSEQLRCMNCLRQQKDQQQDGELREQTRFGHCQAECQPNKVNDDKDLERSTFARFELVGSPSKYGIKRSQMLSQYIVKAQNPASQNTLIQVIAVSELNFREQSDNTQQKVQMTKQSTKDSTLLYANQWELQEKRFFMNGDEEFEKQSPFHKVQMKEQKAARVIRQILKQWSDKKSGYELDTALLFNRLVDIIRQSSVQEIRSIEQSMQEVAGQHEGQSEHSKQLAMTIFHDALASASTRNALFVLVQKIMKSEITATKAVQLLKAYTASQIAPSESQATLLEKIAKHEVAHRSPALKQTVWLSFGQTVGAICQDKPTQGQKEQFRVSILCSQSKKEQYKKTLMAEFEKADSIYEQILALKTIGNAALDNMIEELKHIIKNKQQPMLVRVEAIDALRRLRTSQPHEIRKILLPIFQNQQEKPEIRMAAFSMIMYTQPEPSVVDQMIFTTINDRSQNVKSFVMTTLESLSKSPAAAEQRIANHMKASLKLALKPEELRASRKYNIPVYVSEQENTEEQNIFLTLASIVSPTSMLPVHLSTSLRTAFNGEASEENLKLSISQKGLEQWYSQLHEYVQQYGQDEQTERRFAKDLRSIYSGLQVKNRRAGSYYLSSNEESTEQEQGSMKTGDTFGMIVLRTNDVDYTIVPLSEQQLPEIVRKLMKGEKPSLMAHIEQLTSGQQQFFRQHIATKFGEKITKIPTSSGLPLALRRHVSAVASVEGELSLKYESDSLQSSSRGLTAELKFRTSGIASHQHQAKVWSPVLESGVETVRTVELHGPMGLNVRVNRERGLEIKLNLPQEGQKVRFAAIHTLPVTFTRQYDMTTRQAKEARVKTINNWSLEHTLREKQQQEGEVIQIDGHYHDIRSLKQIVQAMYTTENNVHFVYNPTDRAPKSITLRVQGFGFEKHSQHSRPELDNFYSKNKGFQSIYEDDEDESMDYEKRSQSLNTYSQQYSNKDAYKHQLRVEVEAHCGQQTHKASVELKGACDAGMKHCKLFIDAERTPMHAEGQQWTMKTKIQTVLPEGMRQDESEEQMSNKQSRALLQVESQWGSEQRSHINIKMQAEPQRKQQQSVRFLNKIDLVADYQLHSAQKHMAQRLYEVLKAKYFWSLSSSVEEKRSNEGENVVRVQLVVDPITRRHANLSIQTPMEKLRIQSVELPMRVGAYTFQRRSSPIRSFGSLIQSVSNFGGAECKVDDRKVKTFDGVSYKAPMSDCWSVLAKDCSSEEPRFAVLMKKTEDGKKIKIVTPRKTIELIGNSDSKPVVKVNGEKITDEEKLSQEGIEKSFNGVYVQVAGVRVQFDGEELKIKVDGMYKNQQCGLCGHYSDEEGDDFQMANGERSNSLKKFHQSYTLKNEECDDAKLNKFYEQDSNEFGIQRRQESNSRRQRQQQRSNNWFDDESDESTNQSDEDSSRQQQDRKSPVQRTKVIGYQNRVCFSIKPVKECPRGMTADDSETKNVKVEFFCLERSTSEARRLQRQVREGKIVDAENRAPSFVDDVEQPTKCQTIY